MTCLAGDHETDVEVTRTDVYQDFDRLRQKHGIEEWRAKFVERKYAFEEPGVQKGESEWMKVVYGFDGEYSPDHFAYGTDITQSQRYRWAPQGRRSVIFLVRIPRHSSY